MRTRMIGSLMMSREMGQMNSLGQSAISFWPKHHSSSSSCSHDWNAAFAALVEALQEAELAAYWEGAICTAGVLGVMGE